MPNLKIISKSKFSEKILFLVLYVICVVVYFNLCSTYLFVLKTYIYKTNIENMLNSFC